MALKIEPNTLVAGETATITIQNSSRAGEIVQVTVTNDEGDVETPEITLDANGNGSTEWTVPNWTEAYFNYGSCDEIFRAVSNESVPAP